QGTDTITDFSGILGGQNDTIDVLLSAFTGLSGGVGILADSEFSLQTSAANAAGANIGAAHFSFFDGTGPANPSLLYYHSHAGPAANRFLLAVIEKGATLQAGDIHKV